MKFLKPISLLLCSTVVHASPTRDESGSTKPQVEQAHFSVPNDTASYPGYPGQLNVVVIGAGAAGSSAAYWLSLAGKRAGRRISVTVIDNSSHVGGRSSVVYPYDDPTLPPIELGASFFLDTDRNMMRAVKELNNTLKEDGDRSNRAGVWDGHELLLDIGSSKGIGAWWNTIRILWRYGVTDILRMQTLVSKLQEKKTTLYTPEGSTWSTVNELVDRLDSTKATASTGMEFLKKKGVSEKYINEVVDAVTRAKYGQDVSDIHGFGAISSFAAGNAFHVREGSSKLFESFLNNSEARVMLNSSVYEISIGWTQSATVSYTNKGMASSVYADAVIVAAPLNLAHINIYPQQDGRRIPDEIDRSKYIRLHTTLLTTSSPYPSHEYFYGTGSTRIPPRIILTSGVRRRKGEGREPEFSSLEYLDITGVGEKGESVVKILSKNRISDEWLEMMFGVGKVGWVHRKEWDAFPYLPPTTYFTPIKLARSVYYINTMEPFVSSMETEILAARNVVDMILKERFGSSICTCDCECGGGGGGGGRPWDGTKVYGWDC